MKLEKKIKYSGINYDPKVFNTIRLILSILLLIFSVIIFKPGFIIGPIISILFYYTMEYILLDRTIKQRCLSLEKDALNYIPSLILNINNGKSIRVSIKNSSKVIKNELSSMFLEVLNSVKLGLTLEEGLDNLLEQIPSIYIQNIIIDLKENIKYGTKTMDSLELQLSSLEEHYNNSLINIHKMLPIKLCLISILWIMIMILVFMFNKI